MEWVTNEIEGRLDTAAKKEITVRKKGSDFFLYDSKGEQFLLHRIPRLQFLLTHYGSLILLYIGFAFIGVFIYGGLISLSIVISELIFFFAVKECKINEAILQKMLYGFGGLVIAEIVFIVISLFFSNSISALLGAFRYNGFFVVFNFYLFARLLFASREIKFGKDIFKLTEYDGFYVWRRLCK